MYAAAALSAALWRAGGLSEAIHMALKAANDTSAKPPLQPNLKPEEQELARKREEQAALETEMAERELRSANFRAELGAFERQYLHFVGTCYAELDEYKAQIAERLEAVADRFAAAETPRPLQGPIGWSPSPLFPMIDAGLRRLEEAPI